MPVTMQHTHTSKYPKTKGIQTPLGRPPTAAAAPAVGTAAAAAAETGGHLAIGRRQPTAAAAAHPAVVVGSVQWFAQLERIAVRSKRVHGLCGGVRGRRSVCR